MTRSPLALLAAAIVIATTAPSAQAPADRSPLALARLLAAQYPRMPAISYIPAVAWSASLRLSVVTGEDRWREKPRRDLQPFIAAHTIAPGRTPQLSSAAMHMAMADLGEVDRNADAVALSREAAEAVIDRAGGDTIRNANGWSDDMFMSASLLARVAARRPSADEARTRELQALGQLLTRDVATLQRPDGLFVHAAAGPYAWGRANGFALLGLADALTYAGEAWDARPALLAAYRRQVAAMAARQSPDGAWHEVVDQPDSSTELTVTAMTVTGIARGIRRGWLSRELLPVVDRGWRAVAARVNDDGSLREVCGSTPVGPTLEYYLTRPMINGPDDRGGAFALLAAVEVAELRR